MHTDYIDVYVNKYRYILLCTLQTDMIYALIYYYSVLLKSVTIHDDNEGMLGYAAIMMMMLGRLL